VALVNCKNVRDLSEWQLALAKKATSQYRAREQDHHSVGRRDVKRLSAAGTAQRLDGPARTTKRGPRRKRERGERPPCD
jgi:hypothetical protein